MQRTSKRFIFIFVAALATAAGAWWTVSNVDPVQASTSLITESECDQLAKEFNKTSKSRMPGWISWLDGPVAMKDGVPTGGCVVVNKGKMSWAPDMWASTRWQEILWCYPVMGPNDVKQPQLPPQSQQPTQDAPQASPPATQSSSNQQESEVKEDKKKTPRSEPERQKQVLATPPDKPDAPSFTNIQQTSFRVTWTAPKSGSSAISGYGLQYKRTEDSGYSDATPTPSGTVTGYNLVDRSGQSVSAGTSYHIRVRAKSSEGWGEWSDPATVTTASPPPPPNRAPAFATSAVTVKVEENTPSGTAIGSPIEATDADGDTLTYSLGGTDMAHFGINSETGQLYSKGKLDYESKKSYSVTVTVSDSSSVGAADSVDVTIEVTDVNELPQPANVRAVVQADGSVLISWDAPANTDAPKFYRIRRSNASDAKYQGLGKVKDSSKRDVDQADGKLAYRDGEGSQGYLYGVRAFYQDGSKSRWTPGVEAESTD